jgi:hypothetical protein
VIENQQEEISLLRQIAASCVTCGPGETEELVPMKMDSIEQFMEFDDRLSHDTDFKKKMVRSVFIFL